VGSVRWGVCSGAEQHDAAECQSVRGLHRPEYDGAHVFGGPCFPSATQRAALCGSAPDSLPFSRSPDRDCVGGDAPARSKIRSGRRTGDENALHIASTGWQLWKNAELEARVRERTMALWEKKRRFEREIEDRKLAEKLLRRSNDKIQGILESTPDRFFALGHDWRFTY
jgi:PAS domain-containing protein